jgi:hypothetical protein
MEHLGRMPDSDLQCQEAQKNVRSFCFRVIREHPHPLFSCFIYQLHQRGHRAALGEATGLSSEWEGLRPQRGFCCTLALVEQSRVSKPIVHTGRKT